MKSRVRELCGVVASVLTVASVAFAQPIFKCVDHGATAYQSTPCEAGAVETRVAAGASPLPATVAARELPAQPTRQPPRKTGPWSHVALTLGMSDDEVLNMPGWGRPGSISRARMPGEWREEWIYRKGTDEENHLHFVNARLVDVEIKPGTDQIVQLMPR